MINFEAKDNGKQFIRIANYERGTGNKIAEELKKNGVDDSFFYCVGDDEIFLNVDEQHEYNCSLKELAELIHTVSKAVVSFIVVDIEDTNNRSGYMTTICE